mgnify:CR=1 FL=1
MATLTINGERYELDVPDNMPLLWVIRDVVGLKGTKFGCGVAACGACTVHVGDRAVRTCKLPVAVVAGKSITTIEGLSDGVDLHPLQEAFWNKHGLQCGFCTPGMIITAEELLRTNPDPTREEIRHGLEGNICRCTGYQNIVLAVEEAARGIGGKS